MRKYIWVVAAAALMASLSVGVGTASAANSGNPTFTITQTVSGGTDTVSVTGSGWTGNGTVEYFVDACRDKKTVLCDPYAGNGFTGTDALGAFSTPGAATLPCGSANTTLLVAINDLTTGVLVHKTKKLAC